MNSRRFTMPTRRAPIAARRIGYGIAAGLNAALFYVVNAWPGWQAMPFLTDDTRRVVDLVNLSIVAGVFLNLVYLVYDAPWLKSLGDLAITGIGLAVLV